MKKYHLKDSDEDKELDELILKGFEIVEVK